jgi:hypothetical protein
METPLVSMLRAVSHMDARRMHTAAMDTRETP